MPPRITEVDWGYSGRLPSGIRFDEGTGTFSGTPTKVGEYTIPISVWTNYGEDTKDVKIKVWSKGFNVYAAGLGAVNWGGGKDLAVQNEYGLVKLNMPPAYETQCIQSDDTSNPNGFIALCEGGAYYAFGNKIPVLNDKGNVTYKKFSTPEELTDGYGFRDNFKQISYYRANASTGTTISSGTIFWNTAGNAVSVYKTNFIETIPIFQQQRIINDNAKVLFGYLFLDADAQTWHKNGETFTYPLRAGVKKYIHTSCLQDPILSQSSNEYFNFVYNGLYLTSTKTFQIGDIILVLYENGDLYELGSGELLASGVRDFWSGFVPYSHYCYLYIYIQKNDGSLWIRGRLYGNTGVSGSDALRANKGEYNALGMGDILDTKTEFMKLGDYDEIKKIIYSFNNGGMTLMLTESGKLYHTGQRFLPYPTYIIPASMTFQRILPDFKIKDVAATSWGTLNSIVFLIDDN